MTTAKFYTYHQNNSGGSFDHNENSGIGYSVVIEAFSADHADSRAESIGIYFNGCATGMDCSCCGDRWSPAWSDEGTDEPESYGQPVSGGCGLPSYIHYLDGRVEKKGLNND